MQLSVDTLLRVTPHCLSTKVDAELVLMNIRTGVYCGLNEVGSDIMALMTPTIRFGDLLDALGRDYDAEPEVIAEETGRLIGQLVEQGLVELDQPPGA